MKHTPVSIKKTLLKCIDNLSATPELYAKNPKKDFTRNRKLPFSQVVKIFLSMSGKSIRGELIDFFDLKPTTPTPSAFVQQRDKIKSSAFEVLFHNFNDAVEVRKLYKGYRLLAVDGTDLHVPTNANESDSFFKGIDGVRSYNLLHLNTAFDLLSNVYTDAVVQADRLKNEHKALVTMLCRDNSPVPTIYIGDRYYETYNNIAHIIESGHFFLFRIKESWNGIMNGLDLPSDDEFDVPVSMLLTRRQTKQTKLQRMKFISSRSTFDFLPNHAAKDEPLATYSLNFRIVRLKISDDSYEFLATNLECSQFDASALKKLYALRWGIESSFRDLKHSIALSFFHSKNTEHILLEIFARLIMYNFVSLVTSLVTVDKKNRSLPYKPCFSAAVLICRSFFLKNMPLVSLETLLRKNILPCRPGRSYPRNLISKSAPSFNYRLP